MAPGPLVKFRHVAFIFFVSSLLRVLQSKEKLQFGLLSVRILIVEHGLMTFPGFHKMYESRFSNNCEESEDQIRSKRDFR